ncbi:hypothetical protein EDB19DRAFT_1727716 [Suillus lakei]|nr:hypothetical protein EDB19DRAFT_1727716 [Suillus lakei]
MPALERVSGTIVRNLTFQSNNLGKNTTILLIFDEQREGLYDKFYPVVWKVSTFGKTGPYYIQVNYTNDLAFVRAQVEGLNVTDAATYSKLKPGQQTTLTLEDDVFNFSPPMVGTPGSLTAKNMTGVIQDLEFAFFEEHSPVPQPTLQFKKVEDGNQASALPHPVMRVYLTSKYKENAVLVSAIDSPVIWARDLRELPENTTWNLTRDAANGRYELTQAF